MAAPIGGSGGAPHDLPPIGAGGPEPAKTAEKAEETHHETPVGDNSWGDKKLGTLPDGRDAFESINGEKYIFNADESSEFQREFHDDYGAYFKDDAGHTFSLDQNQMRDYFHTEGKLRVYDDQSLNEYGDEVLDRSDAEGNTYFKDMTGEVYTVTPNANANYNRTFIDKNGNTYYKDGLNNRFEPTSDGYVRAFKFDADGNRDYNVQTQLMLDKTPIRELHDTKETAANIDDIAYENIDGANEPPDEDMNLDDVDAKDISDDVNKKIKEYNDDEALVKELNQIKQHEAKVDSVNVLIGIAVLVGVVASLALIIGTGGIAGGVIGAVAAGVMAGHQGIHGATRAPENLSREAGKAKNRMEDQIEGSSQFIKNLRADDEKRGIKNRDFTILSESIRKKAEDEYGGDPLSKQTDDLLDAMEIDKEDLEDLGDTSNWDSKLESGKNDKKPDLFKDIDADQFYS